jgi:hypothetical protein
MEDRLRTGNCFLNREPRERREKNKALDCRPQAFDPNHVTPDSDPGHKP